MLLDTVRSRLQGALPPLPPLLDRLSERWWGLPPRLRLLTVVAVVVGLALLGGLKTARSPWGPPVRVPVAATDLAAGTEVTGEGVRWTDRPALLVPEDVLDAPSGRLRFDVLAGTVLTDRHVASDLTALLSPGEVAVPVPVELLPDLRPGTVVDAVATGFDGAPLQRVERGRLLAVEDVWAWVAVPDDAGGVVATAAQQGRVTFLVRSTAAP